MDTTYKLTTKQTRAFDLLCDSYNRSVLFGGGKGGGKTMLLCLWAFRWAEWLIHFFKIKDVKFPVPVGFIGRKRAVDFSDTTMETFKKTIPASLYEIKAQDKDIVICGKVKIAYGGLDDIEVVKKFNSAEYAFTGIDQAEETQREDVSVLQATLRLRYNGFTPPYKQLYTANPAECWLKDDFIIAPRENHFFIPALPDDNPYLPINYKQTLREAFAYDPALLKAYLEGDWDAFAAMEGYLIASNYVNSARVIKHETTDEDLRVVSCDVATKHGSNHTVILTRIADSIESIQIHPQKPITATKVEVKRTYEQFRGDSIVIDSDGVGEGLEDMLIQDHLGVLAFHGGVGQKAMDTVKFHSLRTQFYWLVAKKFEKGMYSLSKLPQKEFELLRKQLCAIKVKQPDTLGRFQIESKEDMLARGVESPDLADALMMSEYAAYMGRMSDIKSYSYR